MDRASALLAPSLLTRRAALIGSVGAGGLLLAGCDKLSSSASFRRVLEAAEGWTHASQRALLSRDRLAPEYRPSDLSRVFKANGTTMPAGEAYAGHLAQGFADWRLEIVGLVKRPLSLTLAELRALPARTQITRHDCVEGWSAIGGWTGVPLGLLLKAAEPLPNARFTVLHCADNLEGEPGKGGEQKAGQYYESHELVDSFHPQTLIAYALNGRPLDVAHGAPLRLRLERQLGYKQAKYVQRIQLTDKLGGLYGGKGGYWEDRGYEWYAGI